MQSSSRSVKVRASALWVMTLLATNAFAGTRWNATVLQNFSGADGAYPQGRLILDASGNLYGTTYVGGAYNEGTVFKLSRASDGSWTETVLHTFNAGTGDGAFPEGGLVFDAAGNLYGITTNGGAYRDRGTVFELSPSPRGEWTETILHSFGRGTDGAWPLYVSLIFDAAGNLYGTTSAGGTNSCPDDDGCGTVFELSPMAGGSWAEIVLHNFTSGRDDGHGPTAGLVMDAAGNLYGATAWGGAVPCRLAQYYGCGTVFELTPAFGGGWTETVLHSFAGAPDAEIPVASLTLDTSGNLYGTSQGGGSTDGGAVFEVSPNGSGGWTVSVIYSFQAPPDGDAPYASPVVFDPAGNLYGTTYNGGSGFDGTVYMLSPMMGGDWGETILYNFGDGVHGYGPFAGVTLDSRGSLYGTTWYGGTGGCSQEYGGCGIVFELTPIRSCSRCRSVLSGDTSLGLLR